MKRPEHANLQKDLWISGWFGLGGRGSEWVVTANGYMISFRKGKIF